MTDEQLAGAVAALHRGEVVAAATETLFGLLADARDAGALDRVFALKGRDAAKGVAVLLPGRDAWTTLVPSVPSLARLLAERFWPGPLTVALPARPGIDARLTMGGTVAARWPGASDARRIVEAFGAPLTATSANRAGEAPCITEDDVARVFPDALRDGALFLAPGRAPGGVPSTLVDVGERSVKVLRLGRIEEADLAAALPAGVLR